MPQGRQIAALGALLLGACGDDDVDTRLHAGPPLPTIPQLYRVRLADVTGGEALDVVGTVFDDSLQEGCGLFVFAGDGSGGVDDPAVTDRLCSRLTGSPMSIADVNSDAVADYLASGALWLGSEDGTATERVTFDVNTAEDYPPIAGPIADVTGDEKADVVYGELGGLVSFFEGDGAGGFGEKRRFDVPGNGGEGLYPIVSARTTDDPALDVLRAGDTGIDALLSMGDGAFTPVGNLIRVSDEPQYDSIGQIVPIDVDLDGLDDVAFTHDGSVLFARNLGADGFSDVTVLDDRSALLDGPHRDVDLGLSAADVDGDGCLDLTYRGVYEDVYIYAILSDCEATFGEPIRLAPGGYFAAGDLDGDGEADIATTAGEVFLSR